jgi:hypothetical protein
MRSEERPDAFQDRYLSDDDKMIFAEITTRHYSLKSPCKRSTNNRLSFLLIALSLKPALFFIGLMRKGLESYLRIKKTLEKLWG